MKKYLFILTLAWTQGYTQNNIDSCVANWSGISYALPANFQTMLNSTGVDTFYIALNEVSASNNNNGQFPAYISGLDGPWVDFNGINTYVSNGGSIDPGDVIMIRNGVYDISGTITLPFEGTLNMPIRIQNYPNETVVINGSFDSVWYYNATHPVDTVLLNPYYTLWQNQPIVYISGKYMIIEGLTFANSHLTNVTFYNADHVIMNNCKMIGSMEDLLKTTTTTSNCLILNSEFMGWGGEAIDVFGAKNFYVVGCNFHDAFTDINPRSRVSCMWAKGGADSVYFVNNNFHDLQVYISTLILGGCCWANWTPSPYDSMGNVLPVSQHVYAWGNKFQNIQNDSTFSYPYKGVIGFEGSANVEAKYNLVYKCDYAMFIKPAVDDTVSLAPNNIVFANNTISNPNSARLYSIHPTFNPVGSYIDSNCVYTDGVWQCYSGTPVSYAACKSFYGIDSYSCEKSFNETCENLITSINSELPFENRYLLFPNPAHGSVTIETSYLFRNAEIHMYNTMGQEVHLEKDVYGKSIQIETSSLERGYYFIRIKNGKSTTSLKLILN